MTPSAFKERWVKYLSERRGTYEFRARTRYKGVAEKLFAMGLKDGHSILDAGAGDCQFGRYMLENGWRGIYKPIDASIGEGVNLEIWKLPAKRYAYAVAIEVAEHLIDPIRFIRALQESCYRGVVITTPNHAVVDVLGCDDTHVSIITAPQLRALGFSVETASWFSEQHAPGQQDTLLAWTAVTR